MKRVNSRGLILMYHRIASPPLDPWGLAVSPASFAQQLAVLGDRAHALPLPELIAHGVTGTLPDRAVAVTFDDGYADTWHAAVPLLRTHNVAATVFATTGVLGATFWWDDVERCLLGPRQVPREFTLDVRGRTYQWDLGPEADRGGGWAEPYAGWRSGMAAPTARHAAWFDVWCLLQGLSAPERDEALATLRTWAGLDADADGSARAMTPDELFELSREPHVTIGAHTSTHPVLSRLPMNEQWNEIDGSRRYLARLLGSDPAYFSYPHGQAADFTDDTIAIVRRAGFAAACTAMPGTVTDSAGVYRLPRLYVADWDGPRFAERIEEWLTP